MRHLSLFLISLFLITVGCGGDDSNDSPAPQPPPSTVGAEAAQEFATTIAPILKLNCAGSGCHTSGKGRDSVIISSGNFIKSNAGAMISSNKMPKSGSPQATIFSASSRQTLLNYLAKYKGSSYAGFYSDIYDDVFDELSQYSDGSQIEANRDL